MNSESHDIWKFKELYEDMKTFYDIRKVELEKVITDLELIRDGWKIHFVVDFYQVFKFAFPLGLEKVSRIRNDQERAHVSMMQAARAFVFYGLRYVPPPVLIPPYLLELKNNLSAITSRILESTLEMAAVKEWGSSLITQEEKGLIDNINIWYETGDKKGKLPQKLESELLGLIDRKFLDMYFLLSGTLIDGVKAIHNLYRGKETHLQTAYERWKNYSKMTENIGKDIYSIWYLLFSKIRRDRYLQNIRDSVAIETIMTLNKHLMKKKEIVLLISDASTVKEVLDEKVDGRVLGLVPDLEGRKQIDILRTSNTFLTYMTSVKKRLGIESDLEQIFHEKNELADFYAIEDMIREASEMHEKISEIHQGDCHRCPYLEFCSKISNELQRSKEKTDEIKILKLVLNRFDFLEPYLNFVGSGEEVEENIEQIVKLLGEKSNHLQELFIDKVSELELEVSNLIDSIEEPSIEVAPQDAIEFFAYRLQRLNGIPYRISFENPEIKNAISSLFRSIDEGEIRNIKENAKKIFDLTHDPALGDEGQLLLASLLYCFRHYELVRDIASRMLSKGDLKEGKEFILLKCLSYSRLAIENQSVFYYSKSIKECQEAIRTYAGDPRFLNILAVITANGVVSGLEKMKTFDDLIEMFRDALEHCLPGDNMLMASLKNNIAYSITQKVNNTLGDLEHANQLMEGVEELWPREKWAEDFWDTSSCIHFRFSELETDILKKRALLKEAIEEEEKAVELGKKHRTRVSRLNTFKKRLDTMTEEIRGVEKRLS